MIGIPYNSQEAVLCPWAGSTLHSRNAEEDEAMHAHAEGHLHDHTENTNVHGSKVHGVPVMDIHFREAEFGRYVLERLDK